MSTVKSFDLMKEKPSLDIPTLNFVWDWIWRKDFISKPTNERSRGAAQEREKMLQLLQWFADNEQKDEQNNS